MRCHSVQVIGNRKTVSNRPLASGLPSIFVWRSVNEAAHEIQIYSACELTRQPDRLSSHSRGVAKPKARANRRLRARARGGERAGGTQGRPQIQSNGQGDARSRAARGEPHGEPRTGAPFAGWPRRFQFPSARLGHVVEMTVRPPKVNAAERQDNQRACQHRQDGPPSPVAWAESRRRSARGAAPPPGAHRR